MKLAKLITLWLFTFFILLASHNVNSQITIGGQIDISINIPDIIVIKKTPRSYPTPNPAPIPEKRYPNRKREHPPIPGSCNCDTSSYGTIINQNNGPRFDYLVVSSRIKIFDNNEIDLILNLNTGEVMTISMLEVNPNDYNFHYHHNPNGYNNTILGVSINGRPMALNSTAVSLQPKEYGYTAVLNLHSTYKGDFNGTINNIH